MIKLFSMLMHNTPAINSTCFSLTYLSSMSENSLLAYLINCPCACPHFINFTMTENETPTKNKATNWENH